VKRFICFPFNQHVPSIANDGHGYIAEIPPENWLAAIQDDRARGVIHRIQIMSRYSLSMLHDQVTILFVIDYQDRVNRVL